MSARRSLGAALVLALGSYAASASADPAGLATPVDVPTTDDASSRAIDRTWLYADDARVAAPLTVIAMSNVSYTSVGSAAARGGTPFPYTYNAFAANTAQPGGMASAGGEVGLLPRVSVMALGQMAFGGFGPSPGAGAVAGVRVDLAPSSWKNAHVVASAGYLREAWEGPVFNDDTGKWSPGNPHGDNGGWVQLAVAGDIGRLRMAGTLHGEHVFAEGRDPLDVMVEAGASYRVAGPFRAGVEWVGQDLEETFATAAEGGARHFVGPTASAQLLGDRLSLVVGPSIGLSGASPQMLGRVAVAYAF